LTFFSCSFSMTINLTNMNKKLLFITSLIAFLFILFPGLVLAKQDETEDQVPEQNGTYNVPGNPKLKVRVFVHQPKPPVSAPALNCNWTDPDSASVVGITGWHLPKGTWSYYLNASSVPSTVGSNNFTNLTNLAFSEWATTDVRNNVTFNLAGTTSKTQKAFDGKNIITWGRTTGNALAVTYTWYYTADGRVAETDTIMNQKFSWSWTPYKTACVNTSTYDAQNILTHELGHWVGLDDEYASTFANNTMFGYGAKGELKKDTLTSGDISAVTSVYP